MQEKMVGQNIIITEKLGTLRQLGRNALRGKWRNAILAIILYILCLQIPTIIFNQLFGYTPGNLVGTEQFSSDANMEMFSQMNNQLPQQSLLAGIYVMLVSGAFQLGVALYFLASFRGHLVEVKDIFLGFERFGKALGLFLYQFLWIFLWSLLFIIPGIIASIRYSQAFFILADDPEKSIVDCMDESKEMMKGNKATYFLLYLSFIGWFILAILPGSILDGIVQTLTDSEAVRSIATAITGLFVAPVHAYLNSTQAGFYEILAGHLIKETRPAPLSADQIAMDAPAEVIEEVIEAEEAKEENREEVPQEQAGQADRTPAQEQAGQAREEAPGPQNNDPEGR